jgi:hemolysin activation/secretion protein
LIAIREIANRITKKYQKDGYIWSKAKVENQQVRNAIVEIRVFEVYIDKIKIENDIDLPNKP